ncbi:hypothetical protein [Winogradskyella haliclonae]|uniref:Lipocalin-like domain-containing protein n=1 Tax=Winogradskyella haliclonae TaxID=2048558 RepID=A0ABQ2BXE3_9FLAO|nr:hypothetical protein [Winogradskyella haliclonae]GGI57184.1 hypothetical protein GCM10011444_14930 [Winogradskyella haliclonae]
MKTTIYSLLVLFFLISCTNNKSTIPKSKEVSESNTIEQLSIEGNWEMVGFYNYKDNVLMDSFKTNMGYRQVKMFNKNKVMWSKLVPTDSIEWFGYGSYTATDSTLTEQMEYGSSVMNKVIAEQQEFNYRLVLTQNTFSQIQMDEEGNMVYSENYKRIRE